MHAGGRLRAEQRGQPLADGVRARRAGDAQIGPQGSGRARDPGDMGDLMRRVMIEEEEKLGGH